MLRKPRPNCLVCQKEVNRTIYQYCSNKCQIEHRRRQWLQRWLEGLEQGLQSPYGVSDYIRNWLIEQFGEKCSECGWCERHPVTGNIPIQIHHIDGNWTNCRPENLVLLCPNCHSLTPNHGALNKGRGRKERYNK